jgi:peptidylprolyl isomerase
MTVAARLTLLLCCLALAACGERSPEDEAAATEEPAAASEQTGGSTALGPISKDLSTKPEIPKPSGDPPAELQTQDIVEGKGPAAKAGDTVQMQYVGHSWSTGEQFDSSWDSGRPYTFHLGSGGVIPGWDQGIVGMREGGRRLLIIPPDLGYGAGGAGGGLIAPNETLVFVVDLQKIQ